MDFILENKRYRQKILRFQRTANGTLPYKMSARRFLDFSRAPQRKFTLQNEWRSAAGGNLHQTVQRKSPIATRYQAQGHRSVVDKEVKSAKIPILNTLSISVSDKIKPPMPTNCLCIYFAKIELSRAKRMRSLKPARN